MSYLDSQRRYLFPSRSNDSYREESPYVDEEYVSQRRAEFAEFDTLESPQAYESLRRGPYG
jgi:hypothetical protein